MTIPHVSYVKLKLPVESELTMCLIAPDGYISNGILVFRLFDCINQEAEVDKIVSTEVL